MEIRGKQEEKRDEMVQRKVANQFTKMSDRFGATIERENKQEELNIFVIPNPATTSTIKTKNPKINFLFI